MQTYAEFIEAKKHSIGQFGFEPLWMPAIAFDFQKHIIDKALKKGRIGIFADTGLGKTLIQLSIANNIVLKTNKRVLILTPLAVAFQFLAEAEKIGVGDIEHSKNGQFTKKIVICNYERLHFFNADDFECVILDESSILKNFDGKIKDQITTFIKKVPYRFLSTATPSPNDFIEFGTSSEALGYLPYMDMLKQFFANNENNIRPQELGNKWYLKPHAKDSFFAWVNSWSLSIKKPSDFGFSNEGYDLPDLIENTHFLKNEANQIRDMQHQLFNITARTMSEVRVEQQQSVDIRCQKAFELAQDKTSVYWCHFNDEGDLLEKLDKEAVQIKGGDSLEKKEEALYAFSRGEIKRLITKPKITSFGLNWQHCNHTVYFPTWSYEQYYQAIRRFYRFGQKRNVTVDLVVSDGQSRVIEALTYKANRNKEFQTLIATNLTHKKDLSNKDFKLNATKPKFI
jgi:hypothetical protein